MAARWVPGLAAGTTGKDLDRKKGTAGAVPLALIRGFQL